MKELIIRMDDLYNFIIEKSGEEPINEKFIEVPFDLELKGRDGWEKCSHFVKKESKTVKIITEKGKEFEGADKHILMLDPKIDEGIYMEHVEIGMPIDYMNDKVASVEHFDEVKKVYSPSMDITHVYEDVEGFWHHNTYSVKKCVKDMWDSSPLKAQGWTYKYQKGSIGTSIAPVTAWLFENRDRMICVLDDADAFLAAKDPDVMNIFKGVLNTENTLSNPEPVTTKPTIRKIAASYITDKSKFLPTKQEIDLGLVDSGSLQECEKAGIFNIDKFLFREGILHVEIDGECICHQRMNENQVNTLRLVEEEEYSDYLEKIKEKKQRTLFGNIFRESEYDNPDDYDEDFENGDLVDDYDPDQELLENGAEEKKSDEILIPEMFCFTSRVIVISNIAPAKVDDAFRSRCDVVPLTLTHKEFIARCEDVIPGMMLDTESSLPQNLIIKIRDLMFGYATLIIEMEGQKIGPNWPTIKINIPLQFRLFPEMAGKWLAIAGAWCRKNKLELNEKTFDLAQKAIEAMFLKSFIIPMFANTVYAGGSDLRR